MAIQACRSSTSSSNISIPSTVMSVERQEIAPKALSQSSSMFALIASKYWDEYCMDTFADLSVIFHKDNHGYIAQEIEPNIFLGSVSVGNAVRTGTARFVENGRNTIVANDPERGTVAKDIAIVACLDKEDLPEYAKLEKNTANVPDFFVQVRDNNCDTTNFEEQFVDAFSFIDEQLAASKKVLIHCKAGQSRSATLLAAYMMKKHGWTRYDTLNRIVALRSIIYPKPSFQKLLYEREKEAVLTSRILPLPNAVELGHRSYTHIGV